MVKFEYRPMENANPILGSMSPNSSNPQENVKKASKFIKIMFIVVFAIPFFVGFLGNDEFFENFPGIAILLTMAPFIFVAIFFFIVIFSIIKSAKNGTAHIYKTDTTKMERIDGSFIVKEVVEFDDFGFYITDYDDKDEKTTLEYTYSHIEKIVETPSAFMLTVSGVGTKTLFKSSMIEGDINLFSDLLQSRVSSKRLNIYKR